MANPSLTLKNPGTIEQGQTILLATVSPGQVGDTLSLTQTGETDGGTVTLVGDQVIYTAPLTIPVSGTDDVAYTIREQNGGTISATGTITLDAGPHLIEAATTLSLAAAVSYGAGSGPISVTTADLTGDGRADIIVADKNGGVDVLLNRGGGSFAPAVNYSAGITPNSVTTADLTGDGRADIIVADKGGGVDVLMNLGGGSFAPAVSYSAGNVPYSVTTADLTGDGRADIIVADENGGVDVLLNQGGGSFAPPVSYSAGALPYSVTTADLTGDGRADIIVADNYAGVDVLLNEGGGSFAPAVSYSAGSAPDSVTTADLTGDGRADIIVADGNGGVDVLLNEGGGSFAPAVSYSAGNFPQSVTTADLTGDGRADIIVADELGGVDVLLNKGGGSFAPPVSYSAGTFPYSVTTADLTGDGRADIIVADSVGGVDVLSNQTVTHGPTLTAGQSFDLGTVTPGEIGDPLSLTGTISGGGSLSLVGDEVVYTAPSSIAAQGTVAIGYTITDQYDDAVAQGSAVLALKISPDLTLAAAGTIEQGQTILLATVSPGRTGDALSLTQTDETDGGTVSLVGDDVIYTAPLDVPLSGSDHVTYTISEQNGGTTSGSGTVTLDAGPQLVEAETTLSLAAAVSYGAGGLPGSVTTADLTGDGRADIIVADRGGGVDLLLNEGGGSFAPAVSYSVGSEPESVTTADLTGDGRADIIVADSSGGVDVLMNLGGGSFAPAVTYSAGSGPNAVTTADLTGDGRADIIVADIDGGVDVLLNKGGGSFAPAVSYSAGSFPDAVTTADLTGDGRADIIVADESGGVDVLLNEGGGSFAPAVSYSAGSEPEFVTTADLTGDGRADIIVADGNGGVDVLLNEGGGSFAPAVSYSAGFDPQSVTTADLTGDGRTDIIVADGNGGVDVLLNQGGGSFAPAVSYSAGRAPESVTTADLTGDGRADIIVADQNGGVDVLSNQTATRGPTLTVGQTFDLATVTPGEVGDTLSLAGTVTGGGGLSLVGDELVYTAPASIAADGTVAVSYSITDQYDGAVAKGSAALGLEVLPKLTVAASGTIEQGQTIVLATVSPGHSGDSLSLTQTSETDGGKVTLVGDQVIYTAPPAIPVSGTDDVTYTISEQNGGTISGTGTVTLDAGPALIETATTLSLAAAISYSAGIFPYSVTTSDLTGDGRDDIIVAGEGGAVDVLLNEGGGSFAPAVSYSAGIDPVSVTTSDLTGDGRSDIIVADEAGGVDVLLNEGGGSFAPAVSYSAGSEPDSVTTSDLTGDGRSDIIVADYLGGVDVLLNEGGGSFAPAVSYSAGSYPYSVTTADLTGDGRADIIVADYFGGVDVLLNEGGGSFAPAVSYNAGGVPACVTTADLTGDGRADIIAAIANGGVDVLLNEGGGSFAPAVSYSVESGADSVTTADLTGDGRADIIVTDNDGGVDVLLNEGGGSFAPAVSYSAGSLPIAVTTADLTGDGRADILVADNDGGVDVLSNQSAAQGPTLAAGQSFTIGTVTPGEIGDLLSFAGTISGGGSLSLVGNEVVYTAPSSIAANGTVAVSYSVADQYDDALAQGSAMLELEVASVPTLVVPVGVLELSGSAASLGAIGVTYPDAAFNPILTTVTLSDSAGLFSAIAASGGTVSGEGTNQIILGGSLEAVQAELAGLTVTAAASDQISVTAGNATGGNAQAAFKLLIDGPPLIIAPVTTSTWVGQAGTISGISIADPNLAETGDTLTVTLSDPAGLLAIDGQSGASTLTLTGTVAALNADLASLTDTPSGSSATDTVGLVVTDPLGLSSSTDIVVSSVPCFRAGTRLCTPAGEVAVEELAVGDTVLTAKGVARQVIWIGDRRLDCRRHPDPRRVWPVRVQAGAFADGVPSRDVFLSPDHAVFVDGVLVPVRLLVNDATITQERAELVHYFHIELESHDVLLAEGLAVESYLDTGNRRSFDSVHPDFSRTESPRACARLVLSGGQLAVIRRRLARRLPRRSDIHVLVDGCKLLPARSRGHTSSFLLPPNAASIEIVGAGVLRSYRSGALLEVRHGVEPGEPLRRRLPYPGGDRRALDGARVDRGAGHATV